MPAARRLFFPFIIAALAVSGFGFSGCGGSSEPDRDKAFLAAMVPHHESAIWMAQLAVERSESPKIRRLARQIGTDQAREIQQMRQIYQRLYGEPLVADMAAHEDLGLSLAEAGMNHMNETMDGVDHSGMGHSMADMGSMIHDQSLANAEPFDPAFIDAMVPHHEGAIAMAEALLETTDDPELRRLAGQVIEAQTSEIALMNRVRNQN